MVMSQLHNIIPLGFEKRIVDGCMILIACHMTRFLIFSKMDFFWCARNIVLIFLMGEGIFLDVQKILFRFSWPMRGCLKKMQEILFWFSWWARVFLDGQEILFWFSWRARVFFGRARNFFSIFSTGDSIFWHAKKYFLNFLDGGVYFVTCKKYCFEFLDRWGHFWRARNKILFQFS